MARVTRAADHLSLEAVDERRQASQTPWHRRAWDVIYTALADPRPAAVIATQLGVSKAFVHQVTARYRRCGPDGFLGAGRGGRRTAYLSPADETAFLEPLCADATLGDHPTTARIHQALETQIGHPVAPSTVYRLLQRHGRRKTEPRPRHPQADADAQATWTKTCPPW
jgi:transposase